MSRDYDNYQDLLAAYSYLGGFTKHDKRGVPRQRYCKQDLREEKDCRAALARVLRSRDPLDHQLREMLAQLFEPDPGPETIWGIRKLTISFRANRRPRDHNANTHMAWFIWERVKSGANVESAIQEAMDQFEISRERAYDLWGPNRRVFEKVWGHLPSCR